MKMTWSYSGPSGEIRLIEQPRGVFQVKWGGDRGEDIAKVNTDAFDSWFDPIL